MAKKAEPQIKYTSVCVNCGVLIPENQGLVIDNKHFCGNCVIQPAPVKPALYAPAGILRVLCYIISVIPMAGFIFGAIFYSQPDSDSKKFGKTCLIIMAAGFAMLFLFFVIMIIAGAAIGGAVSGFNIKEGYY
jgi:hypothetical protein